MDGALSDPHTADGRTDGRTLLQGWTTLYSILCTVYTMDGVSKQQIQGVK